MNVSGGGSYKIGLFLGHFWGRYEEGVWTGAVAAAKEEHIQLICYAGGTLGDPNGFMSQRNSIYDLVSPERLHGIIGISGSLGNYVGTEGVSSFYRKYNTLPIVSIGMLVDGCTSILVDNVTGMLEGVTHLVKVHGRKRIAFIRGPVKNPEAEERFRAFKRILTDLGIAFDPRLVACGDFKKYSGQRAVSELLDDKKVEFDALIAANDYMAIGSIKEMKNRGIRVPQDIVVMGFDDIEEGRFNNPPLTTVHQPLFNLGCKAVKMMISILRGENVPVKAELTTRLVVRRSCNCVGNAKSVSSLSDFTPVSIGLSEKYVVENGELLSLLVDEMEKNFTGFQDAIKGFEWAKQLSASLLKELNGQSEKIFLHMLESSVLESSEMGIDTLFWYPVVISFFQKASSFSFPEKNRHYIERLWKESLVLIGELGGRSHAFLRLCSEKEAVELQHINQELATAFCFETLKSVLYQCLPGLGIERCCLSLYDRQHTDTHYAKLFFAYNQERLLDSKENGSGRFVSNQLAPDSIDLFDGNNNFILLPLYFKNTHLGFVLFTIGPMNGMLYQSLSMQISGTLEGAHLFEKVENQAGKLMEEIENRIYDLDDANRQLKEEIAEKVKVQQELCLEKERAIVTLESIGDGVITTDNQGIITYLNPVAEKLTGWEISQAVGLSLQKVLNVTYNLGDGIINDPTEVVFNENRSIKLSGSIILTSKDGRVFSIRETISPIRNSENKTIGVVITIHNVSEIQLMSQQIVYQSTHDALTGFYNRSKFEELLNEHIMLSKKEETEHIFCFIDIDNFKIVNETCGSVAGDELLRHVSNILKKGIRSSDALARLGADQFGVLFSCCPVATAEGIAKDLCKMVSKEKFTWQERDYAVTISVGLVPIVRYSDSTTNLFSQANVSCSLAKKKGGNRIHVHTPEDKELIQYRSEIYYLSHITKALEDDRFCLYTQTIKPIGKTITYGEHYEVLIRMIDENGQILAPETFISTAERYNVMPIIDRWAIRKLFSSYKIDYNATVYHTRGKYTINLSGATLNDESFLDFVFQQFDLYDIPPFMICFEITERQAIYNLSRVINFMKKMKRIGCCFSLDDFGAGWTSFNYLKQLPLDFLKIDGSFVKGIDKNPLDYELVKTINHIGHVMGLETIAEYVETKYILEKLLEIGVNYAQGYFISKPEPFRQHRL
ncbi:MAG: EAL domain-containing protein [Spirochaetales bacterium]|nr:EAL domain-containing protein [Spirochaetales bacterium]